MAASGTGIPFNAAIDLNTSTTATALGLFNEITGVAITVGANDQVTVLFVGGSGNVNSRNALFFDAFGASPAQRKNQNTIFQWRNTGGRAFAVTFARPRGGLKGEKLWLLNGAAQGGNSISVQGTYYPGS